MALLGPDGEELGTISDLDAAIYKRLTQVVTLLDLLLKVEVGVIKRAEMKQRLVEGEQRLLARLAEQAQAEAGVEQPAGGLQVVQN